MILKTLKMKMMNLILIQILMMIQNLVVIMLLKGKTLKTKVLEDKLLKMIMFLKVIILKIELLDKVQKLILFQVQENKFRGHNESEPYLEGLEILRCCKTLKLTQREKSFNVPC